MFFVILGAIVESFADRQFDIALYYDTRFLAGVTQHSLAGIGALCIGFMQ